MLTSGTLEVTAGTYPTKLALSRPPKILLGILPSVAIIHMLCKGVGRDNRVSDQAVGVFGYLDKKSFAHWTAWSYTFAFATHAKKSTAPNLHITCKHQQGINYQTVEGMAERER